MADHLVNHAEPTWAHLLLTHGASEPMDGAFLTTIAEGLAAVGISVTRFEFDYLAQVRNGAARRPPPKMPVLEEEFLAKIAANDLEVPLFIGGKSMGGRVASLIAEDRFAAGTVAGLICLGYPFHPVGKPDKLRTGHLKDLAVPALICQGTRDPFGTVEDVDGYELSPAIELHWVKDGDHSFKPRKRSGTTQEENMSDAIEAVARFIRQHAGEVSVG